MLTDLDLAHLVQDLYDEGALTSAGRFDVEGITGSLTQVGEDQVVIFRGSVTPQDWLRDFRGWPHQFRSLGYCHEGFTEGMGKAADEGWWGKLDGTKPVYFAGHSLGAARACVAAGMWVTGGNPVEGLVTFGTPRPGFSKLAALLAPACKVNRWYRNGTELDTDPVTLVPSLLDPFDHLKPLYVHPGEEIRVNEMPPLEDPWGPLRTHHMFLYTEGVRKLC